MSYQNWIETKKLLDAGIRVLVSSIDKSITYSKTSSGLSIASAATSEWNLKECRVVLVELLIYLAENSVSLGDEKYAHQIAYFIYQRMNIDMDGPDLYRLAMQLFSDLGMMSEILDMSTRYLSESGESLTHPDIKWESALAAELIKFKNQVLHLDLENCEMNTLNISEKVKKRQLLLYYAAKATYHQSLGPKFDYFILKVKNSDIIISFVIDLFINRAVMIV